MLFCVQKCVGWVNSRCLLYSGSKITLSRSESTSTKICYCRSFSSSFLSSLFLLYCSMANRFAVLLCKLSVKERSQHLNLRYTSQSLWMEIINKEFTRTNNDLYTFGRCNHNWCWCRWWDKKLFTPISPPWQSSEWLKRPWTWDNSCQSAKVFFIQSLFRSCACYFHINNH
jgi:hypothetical protein